MLLIVSIMRQSAPHKPAGHGMTVIMPGKLFCYVCYTTLSGKPQCYVTCSVSVLLKTLLHGAAALSCIVSSIRKPAVNDPSKVCGTAGTQQ
jgi:hypothetical protein